MVGHKLRLGEAQYGQVVVLKIHANAIITRMFESCNKLISFVVYITFNVVAPVSQTHHFFLDFSIGIEVRVCRNAPSKCEFFTGYQGCAIKSLWKDT